MSHGPIMSCSMDECPPNTPRRVALGDVRSNVVYGWVTHQAHWPGRVGYLWGCWHGVAHMIGVVTDRADLEFISGALRGFQDRMEARERSHAE